MKSYKRLQISEREELSRLLASGESLRAIARSIGRSPSSICRELRLLDGRDKGSYRAHLAHRQSKQNSRSRKLGKGKLLGNPDLKAAVYSKLKLFWSPGQIAEHLKMTYDNPDMHISPETIYTYIYVLPRGSLKKEVSRYLRRGREKRRSQKYGNCGSRGAAIDEMISIEERPKEVADRTIPGHWEGDLIIGNDGKSKQSALGTLVERTTRTVILVPLKDKTAKSVRAAFAKEIKKLPKQLRLSLTYDQGSEMAQHKLFTKETKMKVYFAHPKSPWERGTCENTNGLIRQFFPTNTNFRKVSRREIKWAQKLLNERPRKTLNWRTPKEAMADLLR